MHLCHHVDVLCHLLDAKLEDVERKLLNELLILFRTDTDKWNICDLNFDELLFTSQILSFQWRHSRRDGVSNHQPYDSLLNRLFMRRSKKTSNLRVAGLCEGEFTGDRWIPRTHGQ